MYKLLPLAFNSFLWASSRLKFLTLSETTSYKIQMFNIKFGYKNSNITTVAAQISHQ